LRAHRRAPLHAPQHEPKDLRRARIDPLHVVESEKSGPSCQARARRREARARATAPPGADRRLPQQQGVSRARR
jgi:hypothetical protein